MKVATYDQEGKEVGQTLLPKEVFGLTVNQELIHQVAINENGLIKVDVSSIKTGIYFIKIISGNRSTINKVIIF